MSRECLYYPGTVPVQVSWLHTLQQQQCSAEGAHSRVVGRGIPEPYKPASGYKDLAFTRATIAALVFWSPLSRGSTTVEKKTKKTTVPDVHVPVPPAVILYSNQHYYNYFCTSITRRVANPFIIMNKTFNIG